VYYPFFIDNGNFHSEHGLSEKWFPHEESIRVPLVVWDPRLPKSKRGLVNDEYVLSIDLAPTILKAAGVQVPNTMQGRDFSDLYLKKNVEWRKEWCKYYFYMAMFCLRATC
jgi:arylsulfatase